MQTHVCKQKEKEISLLDSLSVNALWCLSLTPAHNREGTELTRKLLHTVGSIVTMQSPRTTKSPSKQIAAIRMYAISWHYFKCQQQTRYSLGRWWWRGVFRWTCGRNTTADKTIALNWEGRLASLSMSFTLFCFENMTRTMNYEFLRIVRHKSNNSWMEGKHVTVSQICIADTFCFYNWLWVAFWYVVSL